MLTNRLCRATNGFVGNLIGGLLVGLIVVHAGQSTAQAEMRDAFKRAIPATVGVEWRDTTGKSPDQIHLSSGTLVSDDGLLITVLEAPDSQGYSVTLSDGRVFPAKLVVDDRRSRLKLLKIDATNLPFLPVSKSPLSIGDDVATTACDDLVNRVAAKGYVVALDKELNRFGDEFRNQLELTVGPMSAGAPVFDELGGLCGIIAAAVSGKSISYAASVWQIQALLDTPRSDLPKIIRRGRIGVVLAEDQKNKGRAVVRQVVKESTGAAAGMQDGDWIQAFNGVTISSGKDLFRRISRFAAGETVQLTIRRDGEEQNREISVALDPIQDDHLKSATSSLTGDLPGPPHLPGQPGLKLVTPPMLLVGPNGEELRVAKEASGTQISGAFEQPAEKKTESSSESETKTQDLPPPVQYLPYQYVPQAVTKTARINKATAVQPQVTIKKEIKPKGAFKVQPTAPVYVGPVATVMPVDSSDSWQLVVPSIRIERSDVDKAIEQIKANMAEQAKREIDEQKEKQKLLAEFHKQREQIKHDREELDKVRAQLERDRKTLKQVEKVLEEVRSITSKLPQGNAAPIDAGNKKK